LDFGGDPDQSGNPGILKVIFTTVDRGGYGYWHQRADERYGNPPQR